MASDSDSDGGEGRHPSPLEVAAMQLLQQRDEADGIVSAILPALQVLVSGVCGASFESCLWQGASAHTPRIPHARRRQHAGCAVQRHRASG